MSMTRSPDSARYGWARIAAAVAFLAAVAQAATIAFPSVPLAAGSEPRCAALRIDPFANRNAYVLFDGNVKDGYGRMYIWSPDEPRYATPQAVAVAEQNRFPALTFQSAVEREAAVVSWQIVWQKAKGGEGGNYFDYVTGKTVERERREFDYVNFYFQTDYARGPKEEAVNAKPAWPLDVTMRGDLGTPGSPTNLPPSLAPWEHLNYYMAVKPYYGEKSKAGLAFVGKLNYGGQECVVRSLPKDTEVRLVVAPYLEAPIRSNALTRAEALGAEGTKVDLPYGWYDLGWEFNCPGLAVQPRLDVVLRPYALNPPVPGGL